jgi:hypothetical protein
MIPASYKEHAIWGYALTAWNCGYGSTDSETRGRWAQGLEVLADFLADESRKYRRELLRGLPTISVFPGLDEVAKTAGSAG